MSVVRTIVAPMLANVYVDGSNLYYGIKRWPDSKWLDLGALYARLLPNDRIHRIGYFTAHLKGQANESELVRCLRPMQPHASRWR